MQPAHTGSRPPVPRSARGASPSGSTASPARTSRSGSPAIRRVAPTRCVACRGAFPKWRFQRLRAKQPAPGLIALGSRASKGIPPWVAIFDSAGAPRWWYSSDTRPINVQVLRGGTVAWSRAFGDGYGRDPRQAQEIHALSGKLLRVLRPQRQDLRPARADPGARPRLPGRELRPPRAGRPEALRRAEAGGDRLSRDPGAVAQGPAAAALEPAAQDHPRRHLRPLVEHHPRQSAAPAGRPADLRRRPRQRDRALGAPAGDLDPPHQRGLRVLPHAAGSCVEARRHSHPEVAGHVAAARTPPPSCSAASTTSGSTGRAPSASSTTAPAGPARRGGGLQARPEEADREVPRGAGRPAGPQGQLLRLACGRSPAGGWSGSGTRRWSPPSTSAGRSPGGSGGATPTGPSRCRGAG